MPEGAGETPALLKKIQSTMNKDSPLFTAWRLVRMAGFLIRGLWRLFMRVWGTVVHHTASEDSSQSKKSHGWLLAGSILFHLLILGALGSIVYQPQTAPAARFQASSLDHWEQSSPSHVEDEAIQAPESDLTLEEEVLGTESIGMDSVSDGGGSYSLDLVALSNPGGSSGFNLLNPSPSALVAGNGLGTGTTGGGGSGGSGKGSSGKGKKLFGMDVQTTNQGILVILDTSGSMEPLAARIRATVEADFPDATVITAKGALFATEKTITKMKKERGASDFYTNYYSSMLEYTVIPQVNRHLLSLSTPPESIYFFSDFADFVDSAAVREFTEFLTSKKIKFFAHSVGKEPDSAITRLCKNTGGQELIEK